MKKALLAILSGVFFLMLASWAKVKKDTISEGKQPQISEDNRGIIRVVFGQEDKIFCSTSTDKGIVFSEPVLVAQIHNMHLGMSRGPQIASSGNYSVITAIDKSGNIHWFQLNHSAKSWKDMGTINNIKGSAPEGLMSIAADKKDHFYAVWLDTRTGNKNQIYFSSLIPNAKTWSKNILAYQSPAEHVCECCKPNISVQGSEVAIMFRNWLNGSRDLYLLRSSNSGQSFTAAQKLGMGTWKLNGCPMDGGGINISGSDVQTTWQRKGVVYYCKLGQPEVTIGKGRTCSISGTGNNTAIAMQVGDMVKIVTLKNKNEITIGKGSFLRFIVLPDKKIICVWEQDNEVKFKKV
ncbi:hypothetical protein AAKU52_002643 [Pedobacter sp. CG_S7]|uniref:hypothetical protein n=1 Tax=Pedobacter sp. CG_S7 TaxID=3143930 RepID=UPI00339A4609